MLIFDTLCQLVPSAACLRQQRAVVRSGSASRFCWTRTSGQTELRLSYKGTTFQICLSCRTSLSGCRSARELCCLAATATVAVTAQHLVLPQLFTMSVVSAGCQKWRPLSAAASTAEYSPEASWNQDASRSNSCWLWHSRRKLTAHSRLGNDPYGWNAFCTSWPQT